MPVFKSKVEKGFTVIDNEIINGSLSSIAKTVLIWLISKPSDWVVIKSVIKKELDLGEHVFRRVYKELLNAGYIEENVERTKKGRFSNIIINVYDKPKSIPKNPESKIVEATNIDKPHVENPLVDKQTLLNTDKSINKKTTNDEQRSCLLQPESEISGVIEHDFFKDLSSDEIRILTLATAGLDKHLLQQITQEFKLQRSNIRNSFKWLVKMIFNAKKGCFTPTDSGSIVRDQQAKVDLEERRISNQRIVSLSLEHAKKHVLYHSQGIEPAQPGRAIDLMNANRKEGG